MNAHQKIVKDNARTILRIITRHYGCQYSSALYQILKEHPDFPSFLSFQYILHRIGKDSFAIHTSYKELTNITTPFIAHIVTNIDLFLFIIKVTPDSVSVIDEKGKVECITKKNFEEMWDGNILIIDNLPGKIDIPLKSKFNAIVYSKKDPFFILCTVVLFVFLLILKHEESILFYLYLMGIIVGLTASILLFIDQIDKNNIHIKKLCATTGSKSKIDCSSILDFKDAYFLGLVSWSDIGFVYFAFLLIILLILPTNISQTVINTLSIFSIGYVCYSVFYQKFIARKWCTLCLSVQIVFIFLFTLSIYTIKSTDISKLLHTQSAIEIVTIFLITTSTYIVIKSLIATRKKYVILEQKFNEIVYDENITQYLFQQELCLKDIETVEKLSIGNPDAKLCLFLIFSPICVSCIKELQTLLPIIQRKRNIKLNLIFLMDRQKHPESLAIASHLLSEYQRDSKHFISTLQKYVNNYPVSKNKIMRSIKFQQEIHKHKSFINAQEKWCIEHKIYRTPILFVGPNRLPKYYSAKDIDYLYS